MFRIGGQIAIETLMRTWWPTIREELAADAVAARKEAAHRARVLKELAQ